ncbi:MAG: hypothetical protein R2734_08615 [Nocardioides sp.]
MSSVLLVPGRRLLGNTMSASSTRGAQRRPDLIVDFGLELLWHPSLGMELGDNAKKIFTDCVSVERPSTSSLRARGHGHPWARLGHDGHMFADPTDDRVGHRAVRGGQHRRRHR